MRKRAALLVLFLGFFSAVSLPVVILGRVDRCPVISPWLTSYRPSVRCEGQVCPGEGYQLLSSGLYLVEERYRSLGDLVEQGEVLAVLAPAAGEAVLYLQTQGSGLSRGENGIDLETLLSGYGGMETRLDEGLSQLWPAEESREGERVAVASPVAGAVTQEVPAPGSVVRPGGVIAAVEGRKNYYALVSVGEKEAGRISVGDPAVLTGEGIGPGSCDGVVTKIYPGTRRELSGSITRKVVDIEVSILADERQAMEISPGFSVKAQIFTDEEREILMIPYESIRQDADNTEYVMVAGFSQLEKRPIATGQETADGVEVLEGLLPHELVALLPGGEEKKEQGRYLLVYGEGG